jgi:N-acetylglucosaminyldiphosphoundecaprenol N-acetyl-beta-D-mannosaminyltransferase
MTTHRIASILGVPVDDVTMDEAIDRISAMVEHGRATGRVHQIATVNVDFVCNAIGDDRLMRILGRTDLSIADGMPLVWGSRLLGTPLRERVTGADLVPALVERAATCGHRVYFFGGAPTVAASAAAVLRERYPGAEIVADAGPMFADPTDMDPAALAPIKAARPDICCIALGNPKQEFWIDRFGADVGAPVIIGVGGTLDFVSGAKRRAPGWAQRGGVEWVHRAVTEPRRLIRRYARDLIVFGPRMARQILAMRTVLRGRAGTCEVVHASGVVTVRVGGRSGPLEGHDVLDERSWRDVETAAAEGTPIVVDFARCRRVAGRDIATVVEIARLAARSGAVIEIVHLGASTRRQLVAARLGHLLDQPIRGLDGKSAE